MEKVLAVDLAEIHSASCLLGPDGEIISQRVLTLTGTWPEKLQLLTAWYKSLPCGRGTRVLVEDIHPFAINAKPGCRTQGLIIAAMATDEIEPEFIMPTKWQKHFGYKKQKGRSSKGWAKEKCLELGYVLPEWAVGGKQYEDLRDAYLIARYGLETME